MSCNGPLVSIMIPTYNQENCVSRAIESAASQSYQNIEIVISDDASPDATALVVKKYANDPRVKYFRNGKNLGRVKNYRKTLYERCSGEWVINLDGDDFFCNDSFIERAMQRVAADKNIVMVCARVEKIYKGSSNTEMNMGLPQTISGQDAFLEKYENFFHFHAGTLYNKNIAKSVGFYEQDLLSADQISLHKLCLFGDIAVLPITAAHWSITGENASMDVMHKEKIDNLYSLFAPYEFAKEKRMLPATTLEEYLFKKFYDCRFKAYAILKDDKDLEYYNLYMRAVKKYCPKAYYKIAYKPKFILKQMKLAIAALFKG